MTQKVTHALRRCVGVGDTYDHVDSRRMINVCDQYRSHRFNDGDDKDDGNNYNGDDNDDNDQDEDERLKEIATGTSG